MKYFIIILCTKLLIFSKLKGATFQSLGYSTRIRNIIKKYSYMDHLEISNYTILKFHNYRRCLLVVDVSDFPRFYD